MIYDSLGGNCDELYMLQIAPCVPKILNADNWAAHFRSVGSMYMFCGSDEKRPCCVAQDAM